MKRALTIVLSLLGAILALLGLRSLAGKRSPQKTIERANTIPHGRTGEDGLPIPVGEPDSKGLTQAPVQQLELPGIFGDQTSVGVGDQKVQLPDGVSPSDVDTVVIAQPRVDRVKVEDRSAITEEQLLQLLRRYNVDQPPDGKP